MDKQEMEKLDLEELDQVAGGFTDEQLTPEELEKLNWYRAEALKLDEERHAIMAEGHMPNPFKTKAFVREYNIYCRYLRQKYGNS